MSSASRWTNRCHSEVITGDGEQPVRQKMTAGSKSCGLGVVARVQEREASSPSEEGVAPEESTKFARVGIDKIIEDGATAADFQMARVAKLENLDSHPQLERLIFTSCFIEKLENLDNLPNLQVLEFYQNRIKKIENIAHLVSLTTLDLSFNEIRLIENMESLVNLTHLYLSSNKVSEMAGLETLTNVEMLELGNNRIREIRCLENMTKLEQLWLGKNKITSMSIPRLPELEIVSMQSNRLEAWDEAFFYNAPALRELYLSQNRLPNPPEALAILAPTLTLFDLGGNSVSELGTIAQLTNLKELWLNDNNISTMEEVKKLSALTNLETVYLEGNPIKLSLGPSYRTQILETLPWLKQLDATSLDHVYKIAGESSEDVSGIMKREA